MSSINHRDTQPAEPGPSYQVPALEKGLDILECLAAHGVSLTQAQLARTLGRGPSELFRMLSCLERRNYLQRDPASGAYSLTLRLFELSRAHSPFEGLLRAAARPMRTLTEQVRESCHLSVIHNDTLLVIAQEESPARVRLSVEVGGSFPLLHTASGRLLLAMSKPEAARTLIEVLEVPEAEQRRLAERLEQIRTQGYEHAEGETTEGVSDLAVLVGSAHSHVRAALTVASLTRRASFVSELLPIIRECAMAITQAAGLREFG